MGNKYSCLSVKDDQRRVNVVVSSPPVSRVTLKSHKSDHSLSTLQEKDHHSDHCCRASPPFPFPPPSLIHPALSAKAHLAEQATPAYLAFLKAFPHYQSTWIIDTLRSTDLARLDRAGETYVDYMGGAQHPDSLVRIHSDFLTRNIMGNTHSVSNRQVASHTVCPISCVSL